MALSGFETCLEGVIGVGKKKKSLPLNSTEGLKQYIGDLTCLPESKVLIETQGFLN